MRRHPPIRPALALLLLLAPAACRRAAPSATAISAPSTARAAQPARPALSDANIAAVVVAANDADISYAEIALARATSAPVRAFAQTMANDHRAVNRAAGDLVARLGVTPEDNESSLDLRDDAEEKRDVLRELSGAAFDSAYIANEVTYHRNVLATIDRALIPGAANAELRSLLVSVRPAFAAHLAHAEQIQAALRK